MKVLMVCLGNICRSPMAEGILRHRAAQRGIALEIDSAGTSRYHIGDPPDERAIRCLRGYGIDISMLRARQFQAEDYLAFDRIFAMDENNLRNILGLAPSPEHAAKAELFLNQSHPGKNHSVPDPWFGDRHGFHEVHALLDEACTAFLDRIEEQSFRR